MDDIMDTQLLKEHLNAHVLMVFYMS